MSITFPGDSAEYRAARDRLLAQEIDLRRAWKRWPPPGANYHPAGSSPRIMFSTASARTACLPR